MKVKQSIWTGCNVSPRVGRVRPGCLWQNLFFAGPGCQGQAEPGREGGILWLVLVSLSWVSQPARSRSPYRTLTHRQHRVSIYGSRLSVGSVGATQEDHVTQCARWFGVWWNMQTDNRQGLRWCQGMFMVTHFEVWPLYPEHNTKPSWLMSPLYFWSCARWCVEKNIYLKT